MVQDVVVLAQEQVADHLPDVIRRRRTTGDHIIDMHDVLAGIYFVE
jgi:hypothetical protein